MPFANLVMLADNDCQLKLVITVQKNPINQWIDQGLIKPGSEKQAVAAAGGHTSPHAWRAYIERGLLFFAILALACAVIFFFAFNWEGMSRFTKFALVELALLLSFALYWRKGKLSMWRHAMALMMAMLVGAGLALVGQTYQTGADPWELFFFWAILVTPLVLWQRSIPLWLLWFALWNLALGLYHEASGRFFGWVIRGDDMVYFILAINVVFLVVWEWLLSDHCPQSMRLDQRWPIHLWLFGTLWLLLTVGFMALFEHQNHGLPWLVFFAGTGATWWVYRRVHLDVLALAFWSLMVIGFITALMVKGLFSTDGDFAALLFISLAIIGMSVMAGKWLMSLHQEVAHD